MVWQVFFSVHNAIYVVITRVQRKFTTTRDLKKLHFTVVDEFYSAVERSLKVFGKSYSGVKWIYGVKIMPCPESFNPAPQIAFSLTLR